MNRQLTVQDSRHRFACAICHGGRGRIRQAYRDGQADQLAGPGLVLHAVGSGEFAIRTLPSPSSTPRATGSRRRTRPASPR
ncbi:Tn3 family transposase [Streptomyces sp. NBC_01136]|nr:Tn3 family transposase [Streptomyces sp. NBC_01136]